MLVPAAPDDMLRNLTKRDFLKTMRARHQRFVGEYAKDWNATAAYQGAGYGSAQHGFDNDTTPRYDKAAATLAWQRTVDFFTKHLQT